MSNWIESWLDNLCAVMGVTDRHGKQVRSFMVFKRNELPLSILPEDVPCVVSYVTDVQPQYSSGGPTILFHQGQSEYHLTTDVSPSNVPYCMSLFEPILRAAAGSMKLSGTVELFIIPEQAGSMQFITYRNAEGKDDHQGVVVKWTVKQNISGDLVVSA